MTEDAVDHSLRRWLAPPFTAFVFLLHPLLTQIRPAALLQDPGVGGHLATGRAILATGTLPHVEEFSFTAAGQQWIAHSWLFEVLSAWLERLGGLPLFATVCILLYAFVPLLLYRRMLRIGASVLPALLLTFLAYLVLWSHALARPHVVTYLLFPIFLERMDDVYGERRPPWSLWPLLPVIVLWCNIHGGFALAPVLAGLYAGGAIVAALVTRDPRHRRAAVTFLLLGLALTALTLVNPYGWRLYADVASHVGGDVTPLIDEWKSPDFRTPNVPIMAFEALLLLTFIVVAYARTRVTWMELALLVFFLHAALTAVRNLSFFAIVAAPIVARAVSDEIAVRWPSFAARWREIAREQAALRSPRLYVPVICTAFVALALTSATRFPRTLDGLRLSPGAVAFIATHRERLARPFNTDDLGGALLERFWPDVRVFVDDRMNVYGADFILGDYVPVMAASPLWQDVLARWDIDAAIVNAAAPCAAVFRASPEWSEAYADDQNVIMLRRP